MKFQRRLSELHIVLLQEPSVHRSLAEKWWQRLIQPFVQKEFWAYLLKLATGSSEPILQKQHDLQGQTSYTIYDPITQQEITGLSETEARIWLEQRYYQ